MKKSAFFTVVCFLFLLQLSPVLPFANYGIRPDFLLILTIFSAVQFPLCSGAFFVFALGCLVEVFSGVNTGLFPLLYLLVFLCIRSMENYFDYSRPLNVFLLAGFSLILKFFMLLFCFNFIYEFRHFKLFAPIVKESAYTLLVFPALYSLLCRLYRKPKEKLSNSVLFHEQRIR